jgi:hypothetical protein
MTAADHQAPGMTGYNFAYLDEHTKRVIRRIILKAIAIPGHQVPFASREMPLPYGWGTGGMQVTASILGLDDVLKVIDQGADDTTKAVSIRHFFARTAAVLLAERISSAKGMRLKPHEVETNIVFIRLDPAEARLDAYALMRGMRERGVLALAQNATTMRLVTHLDVTREQVEEAGRVICELLG